MPLEQASHERDVKEGRRQKKHYQDNWEATQAVAIKEKKYFFMKCKILYKFWNSGMYY